jgi:signal transduction histidine kinase
MNAQANLAKVRKKLIRRAGQNLARGSGVRENFEQQLERFYDLLEQALLTGDPAWLDAVVYDWVNANTQTDIAEGHKNATALLNILFTLTTEVAREALNKGEALDLITAIQPIFTSALDMAARLEMENRMAYFANEVTSVQQKLERLDRSKSNFISIAAHELKTPLTLIEGYTSMLRDSGTNGDGGGNTDTLLRGVNTGIQRLRQIVDDMIVVSLIDNNMLSLNSQPLWLSHILNLLQKNLDVFIRERKQTLEIRRFPGSEEWLYADPERLYQAIQNVLTNAIKYTPDGGTISVDGRNLPGFVEITRRKTRPSSLKNSANLAAPTCTRPARSNSRAAARGWGCPSRAASSKRTAGRSGSNRRAATKRSAPAPLSTSSCLSAPSRPTRGSPNCLGI